MDWVFPSKDVWRDHNPTLFIRKIFGRSAPVDSYGQGHNTTDSHEDYDVSKLC